MLVSLLTVFGWHISHRKKIFQKKPVWLSPYCLTAWGAAIASSKHCVKYNEVLLVEKNIYSGASHQGKQQIGNLKQIPGQIIIDLTMCFTAVNKKAFFETFLSKFSWKSVALLVIEENYAYDSCVIYSFFIMTLNTLPRINAGLT